MEPEIKELEGRLSSYVGVKHTISCSSGTDALLMPLMAYGVGPGDAIFTTPFTFIATAEVIQLLVASPVFVDIDPEALEAAIAFLGENPKNASLNPRGVIPVDLFGQPADYDRINAIAQKHGLFVLEDAAQSFRATYKGKRAGALAEVAATSFFPAKPLGYYGDGGAIFTDNDDLAQKLHSIRTHGQGSHKYESARIGINGRLDTLQAAIILCKLEIFDGEMNARQKVARRYNEGLKDLVTGPCLGPDCTSAWAQYSVLSKEKKALTQRLADAGVPTAVYYSVPLHLQPAFANLGYRSGDFPVSELAAQRIFSLPMHPYLSESKKDQFCPASPWQGITGY